MGHTVEDFFDGVLADTKAGTTLPNWYAFHVLEILGFSIIYYLICRSGELYLEVSSHSLSYESFINVLHLVPQRHIYLARYVHRYATLL